MLRDQLNHEKICIDKYRGYAQRAQDPQLQQLFNQYATEEQQHYDTITQLLQGQTVSMSASQSSQYGRQYGNQQWESGSASQDDAPLLTDMLMTEKFVSSAYDTAIFESANTNVRQALQHIQDDEQQHGEGIYSYMSQNGMYQTQ